MYEKYFISSRAETTQYFSIVRTFVVTTLILDAKYIGASAGEDFGGSIPPPETSGKILKVNYPSYKFNSYILHSKSPPPPEFFSCVRL